MPTYPQRNEWGFYDPWGLINPASKGGGKIWKGGRNRQLLEYFFKALGAAGSKLLLGRDTFMGESMKLSRNKNPTHLFNGLTGLNGAKLSIDFSNNAHAIAALCDGRVETIQNISSTIASVQTDNDLIPAWNAYQVYINYDCQAPFVIIPFVVLLENGESIANTDYAGSDVMEAITDALPAETRNIVLGPMAMSRMFVENGNLRYTARAGLDFTDLANAYAVHLRKCLMEERNALSLQAGVLALSTASTSITWKATWTYSQINIDPRLLGEL